MSVVVTGLYVPGDRPERFDKAVATGAQLLILDLEDAVAPDRKHGVATHVVEWLAQRPWGAGQLVEVRVNASEHADLRALAEVRSDAVGVRLPKVESPGAIETALLALGYTPRIAAVIETPPASKHCRRSPPPGCPHAVTGRGRPRQRPRHQ